MPNQPSDFASKVKTLRKQLGMSQEDLTKELGVSFATANRRGNNKTQPSKLVINQFERFYQEQEQQGQL